MNEESMEFGVSYGLLTRQNGEVTISDRLLENLSECSADLVKSRDVPDLDLDHLMQDVLFYGTLSALNSDTVPEAPLNRFLLQDIGPPLTDLILNLAERAGCAGVTSTGEIDFDRDLLDDLLRHLALVEEYKDVGQFRSAELTGFRELVQRRVEANDSVNIRHSSLLALFLLRMLSLSGVLEKFEQAFLSPDR